jgi:hypothetical protein
MASALHEDLHRAIEVRTGSERSFGLVITLALVVYAGWPVLSGYRPRFWILAPAAVLLAITVLRPSVLRPLNRAWMRLGLLLGAVMNPILLGLFYFGVLVPFGSMFRLSGRDELRLHKSDRETFWVSRQPPGPPPESMSNLF